MLLENPWPRVPFTRASLDDLGVTEPDLRRALRDGAVRSLARGVFVAEQVPDSIELRARAVAAVVKPHHVVTDRTAAWLHGIDIHVYSEHDLVPPIEICALRGHEPTTRAGTCARTRDLRSDDVMVLHGVLVTTPLRTALDLGCCLRRREAFAVLVEFAREHGLSTEDYAMGLRRFRGRRGVVQLRGLIPLVDSRLESQRESWVYLAIHDRDLPLPQPQHWIEIDGVPTYRLDFAYARLRVCVEYDGYDGHRRTPEQREHDRARRGWLRDEGWTVIVVRCGDFTGEGLDRWLGELAAALRPSYSNRRWKF